MGALVTFSNLFSYCSGISMLVQQKSMVAFYSSGKRKIQQTATICLETVTSTPYFYQKVRCMLCFHLLFVSMFSNVEYMPTLGFHCIGTGWKLSLCENPKWLSGLEKVSRASIDRVVSSKWAKLQFWVHYY